MCFLQFRPKEFYSMCFITKQSPKTYKYIVKFCFRSKNVRTNFSQPMKRLYGRDLTKCDKDVNRLQMKRLFVRIFHFQENTVKPEFSTTFNMPTTCSQVQPFLCLILNFYGRKGIMCFSKYLLTWEKFISFKNRYKQIQSIASWQGFRVMEFLTLF